MDPSIEFIKIDNTDKEKISIAQLLHYSNSSKINNIRFSIDKSTDENILYYLDKNIYNELITLESLKNNNNLEKLVYLINPFSKLGFSQFKYKDSIKFANLDFIVDITKHKGGFLAYQSDSGEEEYDKFYIDINGCPGGFSEYIQWRRPGLYGLNISLNNNVWDKSVLDDSRTNYLDKNSYEVKIDNTVILDLLKDIGKEKVDIIVYSVNMKSRCFIEISDSDTFYDLFSILEIVIMSIKEDGEFIIRLYDTYSKLAGQFIYILSLIFGEIIIIKPITTDIIRQEKFLVAKNFKSDCKINSNLLNFIEDIKVSCRTDKNLVSVIENDIPEDFKIWLTNINNIISKNQVDYLNKIKNSIDGLSVVVPEYNLNKAKLIWNIPDNVQGC